MGESQSIKSSENSRGFGFYTGDTGNSWKFFVFSPK